MARIRSIKPEFWRSPSTAKASPRARLLYIAMWNWCDDFGVGEWTPRELLGFAFPNDENVTSTELQCLCTEVATCFGTQFYLVNGRRFYCIPSWDDHQKNERRAQCKYPRPDAPDASVDAEVHGNAEKRGSSVQTRGSTGTGTGEQGNRGTGEQGNREPSPAATDRVKPKLSDLFDVAYDHWPKKVERKLALERFETASRRMPPNALVAHIIRFGDAYAATTDKQFTPALGVWIGHERWTDDLPTAPDAERPNATAAQKNLATVAHFRNLEAQQALELES